MKEIAGVIAFIFTIVLLFSSEELRDLVKIGLLAYIGYIIFEIWKIIK